MSYRHDDRAVPCCDCGEITVVRVHPATRHDPGYAEPTECDKPDCGGELDWAESEPFDPYEDGGGADLDYDMAHER